MKHVVICDIDGTVAYHDESQRGHFEYEKCSEDTPIMDIIALITMLSDEGCQIVFMSGREDRVRELTKAWLYRWMAGVVVFDLYMRPTGDHRKDAVVKHELLYQYLDDSEKTLDDIWLVLEDRDQMVEMWRGMGLTCLQVADGAF